MATSARSRRRPRVGGGRSRSRRSSPAPSPTLGAQQEIGRQPADLDEPEGAVQVLCDDVVLEHAEIGPAAPGRDGVAKRETRDEPPEAAPPEARIRPDRRKV